MISYVTCTALQQHPLRQPHNDNPFYDPAAPGQGILIDAHPNPDGEDFIFMAWFTYGDDTASGQHWYTAQGNFEGNSADILLYETTGGSFDDPNATGTEEAAASAVHAVLYIGSPVPIFTESRL